MISRYLEISRDRDRRCDYCYELIANCLSCNDISYTCDSCLEGYTLNSNGNCDVKNVEYSLIEESGTTVYVECLQAMNI